jgi:predicted dienelactone hydrolase
MSILSLLTACATGSAPDGAPTNLPAYDQPGPWAVGTTYQEVTGTDGIVLPVQVWYPTGKPGTGTVIYDGLWAGDAYEDASPDCGAPHPVLAFSHGYGGIRYQSTFFTEHLASYGYVVVAPDHIGNTFFDDTATVDELIERRPQDIRDTIDWLFGEATDPSSALDGCVDSTAGYAMSGHSFGGYTALAESQATVNTTDGAQEIGDDRVWGVIAMAPWNADGALTDGTRTIGVPTLVLTGTLDETVAYPDVRSIWSPLTASPRWLGTFPEAGHYSFSPVACLLYEGDGCGPGFIDVDTFTALVDQASVAFLEGVRGVEGAFDAFGTDSDDVSWESSRD